MADVGIRIRRLLPFRSFPALSIFILVAVTICPGFSYGSMVRHLDGSGQFHSYVDVINRWRGEDRLDVLVVVEVSNSDLGYREEQGGLVGRLRLEVELVSLDGEVLSEKRPTRTAVLTVEEAASNTLHQVFGILLEDVPFRAGRLSCRVFDVNRRRAGLLNEMKKRSSISESATDWVAEDGPRTVDGLSLGDPLYLVYAPLDIWNPANAATAEGNGGWLQDYLHPSRRFGIEQDFLQMAFPVWPPAGGIPLAEKVSDLRVQVVSTDMQYALNDTIGFDERARVAMAGGRPAWVFYELDVNLLPDDAYRISIASLDGKGRGLMSGFDIIWQLSDLGRHREQILGEGRLVFDGDRLKEFLAATPAGQREMLDSFWDELDPDPESPINEAYLEFQYRLAYVRAFLGGFDRYGPRDDRGEVFLLLGPPDELQVEHLPMNFQEQDDAMVKVFDRFAPDRLGTQAKGGSDDAWDGPHLSEGAIPMPYSYLANTRRQKQLFSPSHNFGFELWRYNDRGKPLFDNRFLRSSMGSRFLFVDKAGMGDYTLESSNLLQGEE